MFMPRGTLCASAFTSDTPRAECRPLCDAKHAQGHCQQCNCRACDFCFHQPLSLAASSPPPPVRVRAAEAVIEYARLHATHVGSGYGGWTFLPQLLRPSSVVYSFGIGTDISWDLAVIERCSCDVHGFDNTPASNRWLQRYASHSRFRHHRFLLGHRDGPVALDLPVGHGVSYAATDVGGRRGFQNRTHVAEARTIRSCMRMLNHSVIDVLKLDVEATEFKLFNELLLEPTRTPAVERLPACQLLLEFHSRLSPSGYEAKAQALLSLDSLGFTLIHNVVKRDGADNAFLINPRFCSMGHIAGFSAASGHPSRSSARTQRKRGSGEPRGRARGRRRRHLQRDARA